MSPEGFAVAWLMARCPDGRRQSSQPIVKNPLAAGGVDARVQGPARLGSGVRIGDDTRAPYRTPAGPGTLPRQIGAGVTPRVDQPDCAGQRARCASQSWMVAGTSRARLDT